MSQPAQGMTPDTTHPLDHGVQAFDPDLLAKRYEQIASGNFRVCRTSSGRYYLFVNIETELGHLCAAIHLERHLADRVRAHVAKELGQTVTGAEPSAVHVLGAVAERADRCAELLARAAAKRGVHDLVLEAARLSCRAHFGDIRARNRIAHIMQLAQRGDPKAQRVARQIQAGRRFAKDVLSHQGGGVTTSGVFDDIAHAVSNVVQDVHTTSGQAFETGADPAGTFGTAPVNVLANIHMMQPGEWYRPQIDRRNHWVESPNGKYRFVFQVDGNLVLYQGARVLYASNTNMSGISRLLMQPDGNLVIYGNDSKAYWATDTSGHPGAQLQVLDAGDAVIVAPTGAVLWSAKADHDNKVERRKITTELGQIMHTADQVVKDVAAYGPMVLSSIDALCSLIPGIGTGISSALEAGLAILQGGGPIDIAVHAAYGAIPIPPGLKLVTDTVVSAALALFHHGGDLTAVAIQIVRDRIPKGLPTEVFDTLINIIVHKKPILKAAAPLAAHVVAKYTQGASAAVEKSLGTLPGAVQTAIARLPDPKIDFHGIAQIAPELAHLHPLPTGPQHPLTPQPLGAGEVAWRKAPVFRGASFAIEISPDGSQKRAVGSPALARLAGSFAF